MTQTQQSSASAPPRAASPRSTHAMDMLRADHRRIRGMFRQFTRSTSLEGRAAAAEKICHALIIHMMIEEEIFHPAFLEATDDMQLYCQAEVEHEGIKRLVTLISDAPLQGELFAARMNLLSAMVQHHVDEEEKRDGMLAEAASAELDCEALGERMRQHQALLRKRLPLLRWRVPPARMSEGGKVSMR